MCDVLNPDGSPHDTNTRAKLAELLTSDVTAQQPLYGFEQVRARMRAPRADTAALTCSASWQLLKAARLTGRGPEGVVTLLQQPAGTMSLFAHAGVHHAH